MKANGTYKGGTVAELWGGQTDQNALLVQVGQPRRLQPALQEPSAIKQGPQQFVPDWDANNAATIFNQMLVKTSNHIQGVLAANDNIAGAVVADLKAKRLKPLPLSGQDASRPGCPEHHLGLADGHGLQVRARRGERCRSCCGRAHQGQEAEDERDPAERQEAGADLALPVVWITKHNYKRLFTDKFLKKSDVCVGTFSSTASRRVVQHRWRRPQGRLHRDLNLTMSDTPLLQLRDITQDLRLGRRR